MCGNICVSGSMYVSCGFSSAHFPSVCLFGPIPTCLVLFYLMLFYYNYSLDAYLFPKERQKRCRSGWEGKRGGAGSVGRRGNRNQNILYRKTYFQ